MSIAARPRLLSAMAPFPHSVDIDDRVETAQTLMREHDIRHVPVLREGEVVGVITERDVLAAQRVLPEVGDYPVSTAYRDSVYVVDIETPLDTVLEAMSARRIGSAVVTRHGHLAGIFTYVDVCRVFAEHLHAVYGIGGDPDDIVA